MFTFGREHEKKCAVSHLRKPFDCQLITEVVDAIHDVLEGKVPAESVRNVFILAFSDGGSGVWEQTGSWLRKLSAAYPELQSLWQDLSDSTDGKVRYRVACFLDELPRSIAINLGEQLKVDRHKKTREMAQARMEEMGA